MTALDRDMVLLLALYGPERTKVRAQLDGELVTAIDEASAGVYSDPEASLLERLGSLAEDEAEAYGRDIANNVRRVIIQALIDGRTAVYEQACATLGITVEELRKVVQGEASS